MCDFTARGTRRVATTLLLSSLGLASPAAADSGTWIADSAGWFSNPANWTFLPGPKDFVELNSGGVGDMLLDFAPENLSVTVYTGDHRIALNGHTYRLASPGETFPLMSVQVGLFLPGVNSLIVDGPGTLDAQHVAVGIGKDVVSTLHLRAGARLNATNMFTNSYGDGTIIVDDGSVVACEHLGIQDYGNATISNGSSVFVATDVTDRHNLVIDDALLSNSEDGRVSSLAGALALVTGQDGRWEVFGDLNVGMFEGWSGALLVDDGGLVSVGGDLRLGIDPGSSGTLWVPFTTTGTVLVNENARIGEGGSVHVGVRTGGLLDVNQDAVLHDGGTLELGGGHVVAARLIPPMAASPGVLQWDSGTLELTHSIDIHIDTVLGAQRTLAPPHTLRGGTVHVDETLPSLAYLDVNGGTIDVDAIEYGMPVGSRGETIVSSGGSVRAGAIDVAGAGEAGLWILDGLVDADEISVDALGFLDVGANGVCIADHVTVIGGSIGASIGGLLLVTSDLTFDAGEGVLVDGLDPVTLQIVDGATVQSSMGRIATVGGGQGRVDVTDAEWSILGTLEIGSVSGDSAGVLSATFGGLVRSLGGIQLRSDGAIEVSGSQIEGTLQCAGSLEVGANQGTSIVVGDVSLAASATVGVVLSGFGLAQSGHLQINGDLSPAGTLRLIPGNALDLAIGDTSVIVSAFDIPGPFSAHAVDPGFEPFVPLIGYNGQQVTVRMTHRADVNRDMAVDVEDLLAILTAWGICPPAPGTCAADIDGDGQVGTSDLLEVLAAWTA